MSNAESRGRAGSLRSPPPSLPNFDNVDGVGGLDTNDDLIDNLVDEAGAFSEQAILATGLPEGYDATGGLGFSAGHIGMITKIGEAALPMGAGNVGGGTRSGILPPIRKQQVAPPSKLPMHSVTGNAGDTADDLDPVIEPNSDGGADEPDQGVRAEQPETMPIRPPLTATADMDPALMAELMGGERVVGDHAASAASPAPPAASPPQPVAAALPLVIPEPLPLQMPPLSPPLSAHSPMSPIQSTRTVVAEAPAQPPPSPPLFSPLPPSQEPCVFPLPINTDRMVVTVSADRLQAPEALSRWMRPLPFHDVATSFLLAELSRHCTFGLVQLRFVQGGTLLDRMLRPIIRALHPGVSFSTVCNLRYHATQGVVDFAVATRLYRVGHLTGLVLVEGLVAHNAITPVAASLIDPTFFLV